MNFKWTSIRSASIFEDDRIIVIDKPSGISVMGERHGQDLVTLAAEVGEKIIPVHRIDKVTSGVVLFAKDQESHSPLTRQFAKRQTEKQYLAIVNSVDLPEKFTIDLPLVTAANSRVRIASKRSNIYFDADINTFKVPESSIDPSTKNFPAQSFVKVIDQTSGKTLVSVWPLTGRRHQIRVHLAWIGFPILGDPLFKSTSGFQSHPQTLLHSFRLELDIPWSDPIKRLFESSPNSKFGDLSTANIEFRRASC